MKILRILSAVILLTNSASTNAALLERLGGLAYYDDSEDITWLADANYAETSGYAAANAYGDIISTPLNIQSDGRMGWDAATIWVQGLNIAGITGWRMATSDPNCFGYNCTDSEMGNLFGNVLENEFGSPITNTGPFINIQPYAYWSETEFSTDDSLAFHFHMNGGNQYRSGKYTAKYVWAVYDGDVAAVPIPAAVWLFGSGLIGLAGIAQRKKVHKLFR